MNLTTNPPPPPLTLTLILRWISRSYGTITYIADVSWNASIVNITSRPCSSDKVVKWGSPHPHSTCLQPSIWSGSRHCTLYSRGTYTRPHCTALTQTICALHESMSKLLLGSKSSDLNSHLQTISGRNDVYMKSS